MRALLTTVLSLLLVSSLFLCTAVAATDADTDIENRFAVDNNKTAKIKSKGACVMDAKNKIVLYGKRQNEKFYPASCTKILTALIVLENCDDLEKEVTISKAAVEDIDPSSSHIALEVGEKIKIIDLLYGLILESGNDCAVALAEATAGDISSFADLMNERAKRIGANDSHFTNPHGLYDKEHYTTPADLALIMSECVKNDKFIEISSAISHKIKKTNKSKKRELWNNHRMVKQKYAYYEGVICGKTGFVKESKCNLITYAEKNDMSLVCVCMRTPWPQDYVDDTKKLFDFYFKKHTAIDITDYASQTGSSTKVSGQTVNAKISPDESVKAILPNDEVAMDTDSVLETEIVMDEDLQLPISKGDKVGTIYIQDKNSHLVAKADVLSENTVKSKTQATIIIVGCAVLVLVLSIIIMMRRKKSA